MAKRVILPVNLGSKSREVGDAFYCIFIPWVFKSTCRIPQGCLVFIFNKMQVCFGSWETSWVCQYLEQKRGLELLSGKEKNEKKEVESWSLWSGSIQRERKIHWKCQVQDARTVMWVIIKHCTVLPLGSTLRHGQGLEINCSVHSHWFPWINTQKTIIRNLVSHFNMPLKFIRLV